MKVYRFKLRLDVETDIQAETEDEAFKTLDACLLRLGEPGRDVYVHPNGLATQAHLVGVCEMDED